MDLVGQTIGHFRVESKLGQGGMGVVYVATDERLRRQVALKVLPESFARDEERRKRFLREARSAAAVTHACIATIHEVGEADGHVFIAMELVEGETLRARMRAGLPFAESVRIAREIAAGLRRAHEKGVVHRDLKPENVMIGRHDEVKILDFGLAKLREGVGGGSALEQEETATGLTGEGKLLGTPGYMSPEQARGKEVDARTDVFALGVVLYEMVTGQRPFVGETLADELSAVIRDTPALASTLQREVPPELDRILVRCLEKTPAARYASGQELYDALGMLMSDARSSGPSVGSGAGKGAGAPSVSLLTPPASTRAPVRPARSRRSLVLLAGIAVVGGAIAIFEGGLGKTSTGHDPAPTAGSAAGAETDAAGHGVPITSLPKPASTSPEAVSAYQAGLASLRGADWDAADKSFRRALELDPALAAAAVQLLLLQPSYSFQDTESSRAIYRRAMTQKASLTARDQAVLAAMEPFLMREPPDSVRMRELLVAARDRFPEDAEIAFFAAGYDEGQLAVDVAAMDHVLSLDPAYADAMQERARALYFLGRVAEGLAQLDACVAAAPGSQCVGDRIYFSEWLGECAHARALAKDYVASSAGELEAYDALAVTSAAVGADDDTVADIIGQEEVRLRARDQVAADVLKAERLSSLDALRGRFAQAATRTREFLARVDSIPDLHTHGAPTAILINALYELRRDEEAVRVGRAFLSRRAIWNHGGNLDEATPAVLDRLDALGALPHEESLRQIGAWREAEGTRHVGAAATRAVRSPGTILARNAAEASAALEGVKVEDLAGAAWANEGVNRAFSGRALSLMGRPEAEPVLAGAAKSCLGLRSPFVWVRGQLWLGQDREKRSDTKGACEAYRAVLSHWGQKPYGRTADVAATRVAALHCP